MFLLYFQESNNTIILSGDNVLLDWQYELQKRRSTGELQASLTESWSSCLRGLGKTFVVAIDSQNPSIQIGIIFSSQTIVLRLLSISAFISFSFLPFYRFFDRWSLLFPRVVFHRDLFCHSFFVIHHWLLFELSVPSTLMMITVLYIFQHNYLTTFSTGIKWLPMRPYREPNFWYFHNF